MCRAQTANSGTRPALPWAPLRGQASPRASETWRADGLRACPCPPPGAERTLGASPREDRAGAPPRWKGTWPERGGRQGQRQRQSPAVAELEPSPGFTGGPHRESGDSPGGERRGGDPGEPHPTPTPPTPGPRSAPVGPRQPGASLPACRPGARVWPASESLTLVPPPGSWLAPPFPTALPAWASVSRGRSRELAQHLRTLKASGVFFILLF